MSQQEQIFIAFLEGVCKKFNCAEAAAPLSDGFKAFCESEAGSNAYHTEVTSAGKVEIDQGDFSTQYFVEVYSKDGWSDELAEDLAYHIQEKFAPGDAEVEYLSPMDNLNDDRGGATYQIVINLNVSATYDDVKNNVVAAMEQYKNVCSLDKKC